MIWFRDGPALFFDAIWRGWAGCSAGLRRWSGVMYLRGCFFGVLIDSIIILLHLSNQHAGSPGIVVVQRVCGGYVRAQPENNPTYTPYDGKSQ